LLGAGDFPDPTRLPPATTSQVPLTSQYDALNVPSIPAGGSYLDPTTGVRIYKLTSAAFPTPGSDWIHDYTEGGDEVSLPYNGDGVTRAVLVRSPSTTFWWLVDFTPGPAASGHVGNARQLTGAVSPWADTAFAFSNDPATPYYAYVGRPDGVHRIDIRTLVEAPDTGPNPAWPVADQDVVWLHQSANDEMFVWMRGGNGPTSVAYKPGQLPSARMKTFTIDGMNEPRIDRGGRYVGVSMTTPQNEGQIWDWDTNSIVHVASPDIPFAHIASLRRRWIGMDWNSSFPSQFTKFVPDEGADWIHRIGGPANTDLFHASGNWIQNPPNLDDQWALVYHYGSLRPPSTWDWLAPGGMIFITPNGERRLLGHPYNTNPNYNWFSFAKLSSDGGYVLFTSDMNGSGRSDQFLAEVPVRTDSSPTWTRIEENDPSVVFSGAWYDNGAECQSGGGAKLAMDAGALATFTFTGTGVRWVGVRDEWAGIAQVSIDGVVQSPLVDTYETPGQCQQLLFEKTGLPSGAHELAIEVTATKSAASQGLWVWVDAFEKE
jgi:hypothetical protein